TILGSCAPTCPTTCTSAMSRWPRAICACKSFGRLAWSVAASRAAICAFCEICTLTTAGVHDALTLACARQDALHSASALGGRTYPSHLGACHVPWQRAWHVASQLPWQSPEQVPTHCPCAFFAEQ